MGYAEASVKMTAEPPDPEALGETTHDEGFRRVTRGPAPLELARLRELLLEAASDGAELSRVGLEGFHSWRFVSTLCGTEWTRGSRRSSLAAARVLRRRLRALGAAPISHEAAAALPLGSPVHVQGRARALHRSRVAAHISHISHIGDIWSHSEMNSYNVRLDLELGSDFFLHEEKGDAAPRTLRVIVARGHLVNAERLADGDRISVFGVTDVVADAAGRGAVEREARTLAVRAADDAPLMIRRLPGDP